MKKLVLPLFSSLLVLIIVFSTTSTAAAFPLPPPPPIPTTPSLPEPVVIPVSGDMEFTTQIISIASLPGVDTLPGGMLVPTGFPHGEAQFGGNGVVVTGMEYGQAKACFALATVAVNQGWGGKVGAWNGTKWVLMPSTITALEDSPNSLVCAPISGNGTYAFIKYITDASLIPNPVKKVLPPCTMGNEVTGWGWSRSSATWYSFWVLLSSEVAGVPVSYEVIQTSGTYSGILSNTTLTDATGQASFTGPIIVTGTGYFEFFIRYFTPSCYFDISTISGNAEDL